MSGAKSPRIFAQVEERNGQKRGALHPYDAVGGWDGIRAKHVVEKLEALKVEGAEHLDVHINSPGGDVFEGMAIHTAIASWPNGEKRVHVDGLAASIASIVAMAGDEIEISPTAMVMVHEPRGFAMGEAGDPRKMADRLDAIHDVMCDVYESLRERNKLVTRASVPAGSRRIELVLATAPMGASADATVAQLVEALLRPLSA